MLTSKMAGSILNGVVLFSNFTAEILLNIVVVNPDISGSQLVTVSEISAQIQWMSLRNSTEYQTCMEFQKLQDQLDIVVFPNGAKHPPIEVIETENQSRGTFMDSKLLFDEIRLSTHENFLEYMTFVIEKLDWKSVIILTDDVNVIEANMLIERLAKYGVPSDSSLVQERSQNLHFLKNILSRHGISHVKPFLRFVVTCSLQNTMKVLQQAELFDKQVGKRSLLRHFAHWLIVVDPNHLQTIENINSNLDHVAAIGRPNLQVNNSVLKGTVNDFAIRTLSTLKQHDKSSLKPLVRFKKESHFMKVRLYTLMWTGHGRGFSEVDSNEKDFRNQIFPNVRLGLNKRKLITAMLEWYPFTARHENENGSFYYTHASVDMLNYLAQVLNFTYEVREPADSEWGRYDPLNPGQFTGLIGMMQREEADLLPIPVGVTIQRDEVSDFLSPIYQAYTTILLRKNQNTVSISSALTDPFKWEVYAFGGATLVVVTLMYVIIERVNPFYLLQETEGTRSPGPAESTMLFFGAALFQGGVNLPRSWAGRVLVSFWWLYVMIMTAAYCGNLIASLAVQEEELPYQTLQEVLNSDTLKVGLWAGTVLQSSLENTNDTEMKALWSKILKGYREDPAVMGTSIDEHLAKVRAENYGYVSDVTELDSYDLTSCDTFRLKDVFLPFSYSFCFIEGSPLMDLFAPEVLRVLETGLLQFWLRKWSPSENDNMCEEDDERGAKPIELEKLSAVALMVITGIISAGICLLMEVVMKMTRMFYK